MKSFAQGSVFEPLLTFYLFSRLVNCVNNIAQMNDCVPMTMPPPSHEQKKDDYPMSEC